MITLFSQVAVGTLCLVGVIAYQLSKVGRRPAGCPPGPPTIPLLGNLHLLPKKNFHLQLQKWAEEYGLNNGQVVKDLLDKRSSINSGRPESYLTDILSDGLRMLSRGADDRWRMNRKVYHNALNSRVSASYVPFMDLERRQMLVGIIDHPKRLKEHVRRFSASIATSITFGFRTVDFQDPKLVLLYENVERVLEIMGSATGDLLNVYPLLRYLPDFILPDVKRARDAHVIDKGLFVGHWLDAKRRVQEGTALPSFANTLVQAQKELGFPDDEAAYIAGSLLEAGSDTASHSLIGFVQAMILFPEVQRKAQEEIDRVCGDRLPTMEDAPQLQYIRGCVKETFRWMPTSIIGIPHAADKDDEYMGYKIPKGAGLLWNVWTIHMDPERFPNPRMFDPSRYAEDFQSLNEAANNPDPLKRDQYVFGAGRRLCPGIHIAERELFIAISGMLWGFNFEKGLDAAGKEVTPDPAELIEGMLVEPAPFPFKIVPRSAKHEKILREEWNKGQLYLDEHKQWKELPKIDISKN